MGQAFEGFEITEDEFQNLCSDIEIGCLITDGFNTGMITDIEQCKWQDEGDWICGWCCGKIAVDNGKADCWVSGHSGHLHVEFQIVEKEFIEEKDMMI